MSAADAEPAAAQERSRQRSHPAAASLAVLALAVLAGAALALARRWSEPLDASAELAGALAVEGALPFGLQPREALRLPSGERVLRFQREGVEERARVALPSGAAASGAAAAPGAASAAPDWSALGGGPRTEPPLELYVVLRSAAGGATLDGAVRRLEWKDLAEVGPQGGRVPLEKGELAWHGWLVDWVLERELESGGTFRDWLRADLSPGGTSTLALLRWPRGEPGSAGALEELCRALAPRERAEGARAGEPQAESTPAPGAGRAR